MGSVPTFKGKINARNSLPANGPTRHLLLRTPDIPCHLFPHMQFLFSKNRYGDHGTELSCMLRSWRSPTGGGRGHWYAHRTAVLHGMGGTRIVRPRLISSVFGTKIRRFSLLKNTSTFPNELLKRGQVSCKSNGCDDLSC